jgi:hypothetical protein
MRNIINALIVVSLFAINLFAQTANSLLEYRIEQMNNPVIEEGITLHSEDDVVIGNTIYGGEIQVQGKTTKVCTLYVSRQETTQPEVKPLISDEEIAEINAKAAKYHKERAKRVAAYDRLSKAEKNRLWLVAHHSIDDVNQQNVKDVIEQKLAKGKKNQSKIDVASAGN